jgi:tRNA threonylcarbamoyladenosine biosynthesis protein TsaE
MGAGFAARSHSAYETQCIGEAFGRLLKGGDLVLMYGDLGAGKTCFVSGVAAALGIAGTVTSPTYTFANEYSPAQTTNSGLMLYHIDAYRLQNPGDAYDIGLFDYAGDKNGVTMIEWSEKIEAAFSMWEDGYYTVRIEKTDDAAARGIAINFVRPCGAAADKGT